MNRCIDTGHKVLRCSPYVELLRHVNVFAHLEVTALASLAREVTVRRWHAGALVVAQNEPAAALHIVAQGQAKMVLIGENGREITLRVLRPGDSFGDTALLADRPWDVSVVAEQELVVLVLEAVAFRKFLERDHKGAMRLLSDMAFRLRRSRELVGSLALQDVAGRLRGALLELAEKHGEQRDDGVLIRRRPTQHELGNMVGTCRETVSRTLSSLARHGLIEARGRSLLLRRAFINRVDDAA